MCVLISTSTRSVLHIGNRLIIFRKLSSILIPEILHPLARVKVTICCAVKLSLFHSDPAAGVIPVAVGINGLPFRLITKIPFIHDLSAKVKRPVALAVKLHIIVVVVRFSQPDTLKAAEIIHCILIQIPTQAVVRIILQILASIFLKAFICILR